MDRGAMPEELRAAGVTARELETFWLVADRLRNTEIAAALHLSERTVESHVSSLLHKLGGADRRALMTTAARLRDRDAPLPVPLSSFVGRSEQLADLAELLPAHRLVTLIGPAGGGKTRLALEVGRGLRDPPAVLVDLASVPPGGEVERAFAGALRIEANARSPRAAIRDALSTGRHRLLVDNCEHVALAVAELLSALLPAAPGVSVLATSHGPLRVDGEVVYAVPPLTGETAIRLFSDRAASAAPGFAVTASNAAAVERICARLDGLPLAIELAAARVRIFEPDELLVRLDEGPGILGHGPARHATLEHALRWSHGLLDELERLVLERCSVFPGGFDYDTAAGVASYPPIDAGTFATVFPRLLDRSLITSRRVSGVTEYRLLDGVHRFAADRLADRAGVGEARAAHATYLFEHAVTVAAALRGPGQVAATEWFDRRWGDLGAAMDWTFTSDDSTPAWSFMAGVGTAWEVLGARGEVFDWLERLLAQPLPPGPLGVRSAVAATLLLCFQDAEKAMQVATHAERSAASEEERALAGLAVGWAGMYGSPASQRSATAGLTRASETFRRVGDDWHLALAESSLAQSEADPSAKVGHLTRSADLFERTGDDVKRGNALFQLTAVAIEQGDRAQAEKWLAAASEAAARSGIRQELLHVSIARARLDELSGSPTRYEELAAECRRLGDRRCLTRCLLGLGRAAILSGDRARAHALLDEAVTLARVVGPGSLITSCEDLLAEL